MADLIISQPMMFTVDVRNGLVERPQRESLMRGDKMANRIIAELMYGSEPFDITGVTVKGVFCRPPNGDEIELYGEAEGNVARVQLTDQCYTSGGHYEARVILEFNGVKRTVLFISGDVLKSGSGNTAGNEETGGTEGNTGSGLPTGGTAGQVLVKVSSAQGDATWKSLTAADVGAQPAGDYALKSEIPAAYTLPTATADTLGGVKSSDAVTVNSDGTMSVNQLNGKDADEYAQVAQLNYVSPEMYGAVGDGVADDTNAIIACFTQTKPIWISQKYKVISPIDDTLGHSVSGNGLIIYDGEGYCFTVNIADARKDQRRYTYDLHIQCNGTNNGVNFLRTMGNVFNLSVFDAQIGVNLNVDSPVYENEINSQVEFNNGYGQIALNAMRGDNYFPKTFTKNYAKGVVNAGPNSYDIVHPWLYNDGGDECWAESIAFEEAGSGMGANINYLYIDTVRCGVKSTGGAPTHVGKCEMLVNPDIGDVFSENIPYVHSGNYLLTIDQFSGYQDFDHYRMFDTDSTRLYTDVRKANVSNAWLTSAGFADICFPVNVTNAHANLFGALPTGIKNAYTNGLVYVNPYPNCRQWSAIYWGTPKMYYSELAIPTDYYWIGCELTRS